MEGLTLWLNLIFCPPEALATPEEERADSSRCEWDLSRGCRVRAGSVCQHTSQMQGDK